MIIVRKLDHPAITVKSRVPVYSKIVQQVSGNFKYHIFFCWPLS